jgi:hypothetical protein
MSKPNWNDLSHSEKLLALRDSVMDQIVADYRFGDHDESAFRAHLAREKALWNPVQYLGDLQEAGDPPNKEVVLGAWRDLDRSEALLELIDNSIDAWNRRREQYPDKTAKELNIYIDIDSDLGQLTYEDNAGGVPADKLINLVVPGHSDTDALAKSIGSYKTGGKKAIFRLATAINITTRFWNPVETGDSHIAVHLDDKWLTDVSLYRFPYLNVTTGGDLQRGQTRYLMQLRPEPAGAHWYSNPAEFDKISRDIKRTYGLLMARSGQIEIYFPKRGKSIEPDLNEFYDFSGATGDNLDISPQQLSFDTTMEYGGLQHALKIEVVIGCRVTTARGQIGPGFDLYGNNRLFTARDTGLFADLLPKGNAASLVRGWVNILGPNVFVPWDTHKRHLNYDRDVIDLLRTHPTVKELFANWTATYNQIGGLGTGPGGFKKTIDSRYELTNPKTHRVDFKHSETVAIDATKKRGQKLPASVYKPHIAPEKTKKKDRGVQLGFAVTVEDARLLAARFQIQGSLETAKTKKELSEKAKEYLLGALKTKQSRKA